MSAPFPSRFRLSFLPKNHQSVGIARDRVRLMVIDRQTFQVEHSCFNQLGDFLRPVICSYSSRTLSRRA